MDLSIILLSYNTRTITLQTLQSLDQALTADSPLNVEVIVVDNASTDGSGEEIQKLKFKSENCHLQFIQNKTNEGFSKGNNRGLAVATGNYILYLNSDMNVDGLRLSEPVAYMDTHQKVGIVTPRVNLTSGQIDPASHRGFPTPWRSLCYFSGLESISKKLSALYRGENYSSQVMVSQPALSSVEGNHDKSHFDRLSVTKIFGLCMKWFGGYHLLEKDLNVAHEIDACTGAFLLIRGDVVRELGGFDERFFMYGEDLDLCYRVKEKGRQVIWLPTQAVIHLKHSSGIGSVSPETRNKIRAHFYEAMQLFYDKHYRQQYPGIVNSIVRGGIWLKSHI
ncbi:MAG: glycosyltransferase family 2 protein [bacterium]